MAEVFENFYVDKTSSEQPENLVPMSVEEKGDNVSESNSSSSEEGDNTEDDEDYIPEPDELGGDPDGVQVKKTKAEGTYMSPMCNRYCQQHYYVGVMYISNTFTTFVYLLI